MKGGNDIFDVYGTALCYAIVTQYLTSTFVVDRKKVLLHVGFLCLLSSDSCT